MALIHSLQTSVHRPNEQALIGALIARDHGLPLSSVLLESMISPQDKGIFVAAGKALAIWLVFHVIWMHCLVVWKWTTPPINAPSFSDVQSTITAIDQRITVIEDLLEQEEDQMLRVEEARALLRRAQARLSVIQAPLDELQTSDDHLKGLSRLLEHLQDLSYYRSNGALLQSFVHAKTQLARLSGSDGQQTLPSIGEWGYLASVLPDMGLEEYSFRKLQDTCGKSVEEEEDDDEMDDDEVDHLESSDSTFYVDKLGLDQWLKQLNRELAKRHDDKDWPVSLDTSFQRLEIAYRATREKAQADVWKASKATLEVTRHGNMKEVPDICVQKSQAIAWTKVGLDAIRQDQDVRSLLLRELQKDNINVTGIILDAPLRLTPAPFDALAVPESVNLRQLLDTPLTKQAATWINQLIDLAGGHSDIVDRWIDEWVAAAGDLPDVGAAFVDRVLDKASKVDVAVPEFVKQSKAGLLLKKRD